MSQQHLEAVQRLFLAVQQRDQAAIKAAYHPDVVVHESPSLPYGGDYHGREEALQHAIGYYKTWDALRPEGRQAHSPIFLETTQDYVVVLWREEAVAPSSKGSIELPALGVFQVRDGQVVESRMFQDTAVIQNLLKEV